MAQKTKARKRTGPSAGGDQMIIEGTVSDAVVVQGRNPRVSVRREIPARKDELAAVFEKAYQQVQARPVDKNVDKQEITDKLDQIKKEAANGEKANQPRLERWMGDLARMAPDILDVILACLQGPVSGFSLVFKKIAEKARKQPA